MNERKILVVDWSNIMYRAWYSSQKDIKLKPWLPMLRFLDMIRSAAQQSKSDEIVFAGESRKTLRRTMIDPSYKSTRKPVLDERFRLFRMACGDIVQDLGCQIISRDGAEADDVIASIVAKHCHKCNCKQRCSNCEHMAGYNVDITVFSNDRDLNQLLAYDKVMIYRHPGILYTREDFIEEYGFDPKYFTIYKSLVGDKSDNITGVDGFGPVKAKEVIASGDTGFDVSKNEQFQKAHELIQLDYDLEIRNDNYMPMVDKDLSVSWGILNKAYSKDAIDEVRTALLRLEAVF